VTSTRLQADKKAVLALGRRYGEMDGEMSYYYATAFAKANRTLTAEQHKALLKLPDTDHFFFAPKKAAAGNVQ